MGGDICKCEGRNSQARRCTVALHARGLNYLGPRSRRAVGGLPLRHNPRGTIAPPASQYNPSTIDINSDPVEMAYWIGILQAS